MPVFVYTVLMGISERLNEQPIAAVSNAEFVCFTDQPNLKSDTWQIRIIKPEVFGDSHRSSRVVKIGAFREFGEGAKTLYIDNTVILQCDPEPIVDQWLKRDSIAMFKHSGRESVLEEFDACMAHKLDDQVKLKEQLKIYSSQIPAILTRQPFWGGLIARRNDAVADKFSREWMTHVLRYSRRDQLSVNAAQYLSGSCIKAIPGSITKTEWHEWPIRFLDGPSQRSVGRTSAARKLWFMKVIPRFRF